MTYIPRRDITNLIPNKFEAVRVLALECRRLNDEIRAREDTEVEGKLTTLAVKQMLEGKVTYYDAKERREQERSEAMLSAAEGLLDIAEPMIEPDFDTPLMDDGAPAEETAAGEPVAEEPATEEASTEEAATEEAVSEEAPAEEASTEEAPAEEPAAEEAAGDEASVEDAPVEEPGEEPKVEEPGTEAPVAEDPAPEDPAPDESDDTVKDSTGE